MTIKNLGKIPWFKWPDKWPATERGLAELKHEWFDNFAYKRGVFFAIIAFPIGIMLSWFLNKLFGL